MKYGLFGGSFDPIHIGHIRLAEAAVRELKLDRMIFMPNYISPFKLNQGVTPAADRIRMIETVLPMNPAFELSEFEVRREGPSYTFDTLDYFNSECDGTLYFILGYDSIMTIDRWYRGKEILSLYPLITGRRPGTDDEAGREKISELRRLYNADITVLELEPYEAASSDIRKLASEGKPIDRYVSKGVKEYIEKHGLYR